MKRKQLKETLLEMFLLIDEKKLESNFSGFKIAENCKKVGGGKVYKEYDKCLTAVAHLINDNVSVLRIDGVSKEGNYWLLCVWQTDNDEYKLAVSDEYIKK